MNNFPTDIITALTDNFKQSAVKRFVQFRNSALETVKTVNLPNKTHELWRQTDPDKFSFHKASTPLEGKLLLSEFGSTNTFNDPALSFSTNENISKEDEAIISKILLDNDECGLEFVSGLQGALTKSINIIRVKKGKKVHLPLSLTYDVMGADGIFAPTLIIILEAGSQLTVVEDLDSKLSTFIMPRLECILEDNSELNFVSIQRMNDCAEHLAKHRFHLHKDARAQMVYIGTGSSLSRLDLDCRMLKEGGNADMHAFNVIDQNRHIDFHPTQSHIAPNCRSDLYSKNVLKDNGHSVYYGYIRVAEGAQKTDAYQTNRNLVLSDTASAYAIPNLAIKANDVKCSHGASVGQVSKDELFYLLTRGLNKETAEKLLVEGFFEDLLGRIKNTDIRNYARTIVLERINNGSTNCQA